MENKEYDNLDKSFIIPKQISPFYNFNKIPRKLKKKIKLFCGVHYKSLTINQKLWWYLEKKNIRYKYYLIKCLCEIELIKNVKI